MTELLVSSSVLITVLAVLRSLFRRRIPPGLQYALWLLVLLRLALPFALFSSPLSASGAMTQIADYAVPAAEAAARTVEKADLPRILTRIWLIGTAVMGLWFSAVNYRLGRSLRRSRQPLARRSPLPVYVCPDLSSPCLYGLFRPAVYLTERAAEDPRKSCVAIAHELTHWRHRDHLWAAVRVICLAVYWFDPLVWLAAHLSRQDGELFCDAATLRVLGEERRFEYGRTLLDLSLSPSRPSALLCSASTLSGGGRRLRERIARIARKPKLSLFLTAIALILVLGAAISAFSGATARAGETRRPVSPLFVTAAPLPTEAAASTPAATSPADLTPKPIAVTPEPVAVTPEPVIVTPEPVAVTPEPIVVTPEPVIVTPEPVIVTPEPVVVTPEPVIITPEPVIVTPEPVIITPEPIVDLPQPTLPDAGPDGEGPVVVRDMRGVYEFSTPDPALPTMPSTVPDSPPPDAIIVDIPDGE